MLALRFGLFALLASSCVAFASTARADEASSCIAAAESAQPLRASGQLRAARERLLLCARTSCPRLVRADCTTWLDEVEQATPSIVPLLRDAGGHDVAEGAVTIDGRRTALDGNAVEVDPGRHVVQFEAGAARIDRVVVVGAGEKNRIVAAELSPPMLATPPPTTAAPAPSSGRIAVSPVVYPLAGVALVGAASFSYFALSARSDLVHLREDCAPRCRSEDVQAAQTKAYVADASLGVAIVAAAIATYLVLTRPARAVVPRATGVPNGFAF